MSVHAEINDISWPELYADYIYFTGTVSPVNTDPHRLLKPHNQSSRFRLKDYDYEAATYHTAFAEDLRVFQGCCKQLQQEFGIELWPARNIAKSCTIKSLGMSRPVQGISPRPLIKHGERVHAFLRSKLLTGAANWQHRARCNFNFGSPGHTGTPMPVPVELQKITSAEMFNNYRGIA